MDVKDYTSDSDKGSAQYQGVPSAYARRVESQYKMQPKYCEPGEAGDSMKAAHSNEQAGP